MSTAVIGERAVPATIAAIPTVAYAPASAVAPGSSSCTPAPYAPPSIAPRKSVGRKTPPLPPEPSVTEVATNFRASSTNIVRVATPPTSTSSITPSPSPSTPESASVSSPTISPPSAGSRMRGGKRRSSKRSSVQKKKRMKATATAPLITPSTA